MAIRELSPEIGAYDMKYNMILIVSCAFFIIPTINHALHGNKDDNLVMHVPNTSYFVAHSINDGLRPRSQGFPHN